jgi:hypothetical protein
MPSRSAYTGVGVVLGLGDAVSDGDASMDAVGVADDPLAVADGLALEEPHACTAISSATTAMATGSFNRVAANPDRRLELEANAVAQRVSCSSHRRGRISGPDLPVSLELPSDTFMGARLLRLGAARIEGNHVVSIAHVVYPALAADTGTLA